MSRAVAVEVVATDAPHALAAAAGDLRSPAPSLSLVIPCYNEEANIVATVERCKAALAALTDRYEIVIVNDASTDGSRALADRLAGQDDSVKVIHNPINLGAGTSLRIGWSIVQHDLVVHNSMDYPFNLADLQRILPLFSRWDAVVVARTDRSAHSPWRKVTSMGNYWLLRRLFNVSVRDLNFVQVYKREVLRAVTLKATSPAFVTPEMYIRAHDRGFKITQVRAQFHRRQRGKANYGKPRDILWTLADMLSFYLERRATRPERRRKNHG